jgi:SPP1 family predicted phage head-tail adaptor
MSFSANIDPGRLDRRVTLQYSVGERDAVGGRSLTWYDAATVWAAREYVHGGRFFAAEEKHFESLLAYRIRHRSDVRAGMRLIHGDDTFEIVSVDDAGRRRFLELTCRAIDQDTGDNRDGFDLGDGVTAFDLGDEATELSCGGLAA